MTTATDDALATSYDAGTSTFFVEQRPAWRDPDETTVYGYAGQPALLSSWLASQELGRHLCRSCTAALQCSVPTASRHRARRPSALMPLQNRGGEYRVVVTISGPDRLWTQEFVAKDDETTSDRLAALLGALLADRSDTKSDNRAQRALQAVDDLKGWLGLTTEDVAALIGVSDSAIYYWRRRNAPLRTQHALKLYRVHALVRALRSTAPRRHPFEILNATSDASGASAYDLLRGGRYDEAEHLLRPLIFRPERATVQPGSVAAMEPEVAPPPARGLSLRPTTRRARRVRLKRD